MKKTVSCLILVLMVFFSCLTMSGCDPVGQEAFVGEYKSVFVDSQNTDNSISFSLEIKEDGTFVLDGHRSYSGTWKSYTQSGTTQLVCIEEEGYTYGTSTPNAWSPYFSLSLLDDGTLMAIPGTTQSSISVRTAFGAGENTHITMVLFEKQ